LNPQKSLDFQWVEVEQNFILPDFPLTCGLQKVVVRSWWSSGVKNAQKVSKIGKNRAFRKNSKSAGKSQNPWEFSGFKTSQEI
jgi:hypothetical protein